MEGWPAGPDPARGRSPCSCRAIALAVTAWLFPSIHVDGLGTAIVAVLLMGAFNLLVRPVILALAAPISLILTGILVLVMQIVAFQIIAPLAPGMRIDTLLAGVIGSFVYAGITTTLTSILGVDRSGSYFGLLVQSLQADKVAAAHGARPGGHPDRRPGPSHPGRSRAGGFGQHHGQLDP